MGFGLLYKKSSPLKPLNTPTLLCRPGVVDTAFNNSPYCNYTLKSVILQALGRKTLLLNSLWWHGKLLGHQKRNPTNISVHSSNVNLAREHTEARPYASRKNIPIQADFRSPDLAERAVYSSGMLLWRKPSWRRRPALKLHVPSNPEHYLDRTGKRRASQSKDGDVDLTSQDSRTWNSIFLRVCCFLPPRGSAIVALSTECKTRQIKTRRALLD